MMLNNVQLSITETEFMAPSLSFYPCLPEIGWPFFIITNTEITLFVMQFFCLHVI